MEKNTGREFAWVEVFDALDDLIFVINPDYTIENLNKKAKDFLGVNHCDSSCGKCHQLLYNSQDPCLFCPKEDCRSSFHSCPVDTPVHLKDRYFKMKMHLVRDENETPTHFVEFLHDVTEETKALITLKDTEEKYKLVAENSSDVIALVDGNLQFTYASPSVKTIVGYTVEEFLQLGMGDVLTPESYLKVRSLYATDKTLGKITGNYQVVKKDKTTGWVEMAITPLRNNKGEITGYVSQSRDVSDKKEALDALKISEERYNLVQDKADIYISYFTPKGKIVFMNRLFALYLGGKPEDFAGKHIREVLDEKLYHKFKQRLKEISQSSTSLDYEDEHLINSKKRNVITTFSKITDTEGKPQGVLVTTKDITKLKTADAKIKQSEERLKSLLNITQMDHLSQFEILDHALEEALKFTQSKIGFLYHYNEKNMTFNLNSWSKSVTEECTIREKKTKHHLDDAGIWAEAIRKREPIIFNSYGQKKHQAKKLPEGHPAIENYISVPIFWNKEIVSLVSLANKQDDFTENDIHQIQLLMNTVWKIIERNRSEQELIQAKEKAEESDRLKSSFLSNMSHEIRTPINGIMGFLGLLRDDELDDETKEEFFELIDSNFNHLMTLISDIIDISKLEANQISLLKSDVNINDLIFEVIKLNDSENTLLKSKNIQITVDNTNTNNINPLIRTDKVRLRQVLINLLNNAIKFTDEGEIRVGYTLQGNFLQFCVHDTGIGIRAEQQKMIFEHFRQADETLTRKFGGTGLGLSISKRLVELMGGDIWVESQKNEYSKFYFTLPYLPVQTKTEIQAAPVKNKTIKWKGRSILIIEDDDSNFLFLREVLKQTEVRILRSSSCEETHQFLKQNYAIDLVLLDIRLPDGIGTDLIPYIRKQYNAIPILAQTAFALENDRKKYMEEGCDGYITKPIIEELFIKMIDEKLNPPVDANLENTIDGSEMELVLK
ncbi:PAS domain S-box protein [Sunxiuqinia sp. A32]|uniref:PAS domain S-box protein n=1 Tax=Sunxiuqinia sp. A32 TaxID=3461496 RepID=UPI004045E993